LAKEKSIMSISKLLSKRTILAIDPATHSFAFSVVSSDGINAKLIAYGKVDLSKEKSMSDKFKVINLSFPAILTKHKPSLVLIEETIYISNPKTSRLLAYVVGALWSTSLKCGIPTEDVGPMTWKYGIGYKAVSKKEKEVWIAEMGIKEAKKKASFERKERTKRIIDEVIPNHGCSDYDILDSIGIAYWGVKSGK
jgi:Holliday junction resolvasome RuvABC endonuclease subunit